MKEAEHEHELNIPCKTKCVPSPSTLLKYSSIVGSEIGALLTTCFVPLMIHIIGETKTENIGNHAYSLRMLGRWVLGFGFATFISHGITLSTITLRKSWLAWLVLGVHCAHLTFVITVTIFAAIARDVVDYYGSEMWREADGDTIDLLQNYFQCCTYSGVDAIGVEGLRESCFVNNTPREGVCSEQLRALVIDPANGAVNLPLLLTFVSLVGLMVLDVWMIGLTTVFLRRRSRVPPPALPTSADLNVSIVLSKTIRQSASATTMSTMIDDQSPPPTMPDTESIAAYVASNPSVPSSVVSSMESNMSDDISTAGTQIADEKPTTRKKTRTNRCESFARAISNIGNFTSSSLQNVFYWLGVRTAERPVFFMALSTVISLTLTVGVVQQKRQDMGAGHLLPESSLFRKQLHQVVTTFPSSFRPNSVLIVENEVLNTETIQAMAKFDERIVNFETPADGSKFADECSTLNGQCLRTSLFELWSFKTNVTRYLTRDEVLSQLNQPPPIISPVRNIPLETSDYLGDVRKDVHGSITGATAHLLQYFTRQPSEWETEFIDVALTGFEGLDGVYVKGFKSANLEFDKSFNSDMNLLIGGCVLIFVYIFLMSGKLSFIEHRVYVAIASLVSIGMSLGISIGVSAAMHFKWSQLGFLAPFLLLGVGVDDMFVILRTWDNVEAQPEHADKSVAEKTGLVLKIAGASITVTSMTDFVAFCVGISSHIPFLASFCFTLAVGIVSLFVLQVAFFVPVVVIDQRRKKKNYDACLLCCYAHSAEYKANKYADMQLQKRFFRDVIARVARNRVVQAIVMTITIALTATMGYGMSQLTYDYDDGWLINSDSYLRSYEEQLSKYFQGDQLQTTINLIGGDFYSQRGKFNDLKLVVGNNSFIAPGSCSSWFDDYVSAMQRQGYDVMDNATFGNNADNFYDSVRQFITFAEMYQQDVKFNGYVITATRFHCKHVSSELLSGLLPGMTSLRHDCAVFPWGGGEVFPFASSYLSLEAILLVQDEIFVNLGITFACVTVIILFLISSIQTCVWVVLSVLLTMIDICGTMYFWNLTLEPGTMICLVLVIGLAVDYASHIGYKFMVYSGTRSDRASTALVNIGPAVFNGGFSTFLALVLLAGSTSYASITFFKIFMSVVIYGMWHSIIFLPAILSLVGPPAYKSAQPASTT